MLYYFRGTGLDGVKIRVFFGGMGLTLGKNANSFEGKFSERQPDLDSGPAPGASHHGDLCDPL